MKWNYFFVELDGWCIGVFCRIPAPEPGVPQRPPSYPTEKRRQDTAENTDTPPIQFDEEIIPLQNTKDNDPLDNLAVITQDVDNELVIPRYNL